MTAIRDNLGRRPPPTEAELRQMRERREARERLAEGTAGPAQCPCCGRRFWSWDRTAARPCGDCSPRARPREPANGRPKVPEQALVGPDPAELGARRLRTAERVRALRARRRGKWS